MNRYTFEDLPVGHTESFPAHIGPEEMALFARLTGDENPLHTDGDYARSKGYAGKVAYGMLTASFLSTLAGMYLPGERSLLQEVEVKFVRPLIPREGLDLVVSGTVTEREERFRRLTVKVSVTGEDGTKYLRGTMKVGVLDG